MLILKKLFTAGCLAAGACGLTLVASVPGASAQPPGKDPKAKDGPKAKDAPRPADLQRTYDILAEAAVRTRPVGKKDGPEADGRRYYEAARRLYRDALAASEPAGPVATESAVAAHDAARGLRRWSN